MFRTSLLIAVLALPGAVAAQTRHATVVGFVTDTSGVVVPRVEVSLLGSALQTLTDSTGQFRFNALEPGEHVLAARRMGFAARTFTIDLQRADTTQLMLELEPLAVDQRARVTGRGRDGSVRERSASRNN